MDLIIKNCDIITGDGHSILKNAWTGIDNGYIRHVSQSGIPDSVLSEAGNVLDGSGCYLIPGIINSHTHGCSTGPLYTSGAKPASLKKALRNTDRHMLQGTTSLINVCGMGTKEEYDIVNNSHPVNIYNTTAQFPSTYKAAKIIDASGMKDKHFRMNAEKALAGGAVLIGEIGSGATLGGGVSEYKYIPESIEKRTSVSLTVEQVRELKKEFLESGYFDKKRKTEKMTELIIKFGLDSKISLEEIAEIYDFYTNKPVNYSLKSFDEAFEFAEDHELPIIFHHASTSAAKIYELALKKRSTTTIIAAHCNHTTFTLEECVSWAKKLKDEGVIIDLASINSFSGYNKESIENMTALLTEGLPDIITTDFGGGVWDGILELIQYFFKRGLLGLAEGIHMATGRIPEIFGNSFIGRGLIEEGKIADLVLVDKLNLAKVETVIINGRIVVDGGWCLYN